MSDHVMEYLTDELKSAKETRGVGLAVEKLIERLFLSLEDGKYEVEEIIQDISVSIGEVSTAAKGADKIDDESALDVPAVINASGVTALKVQELVFKFVAARKARKAAEA